MQWRTFFSIFNQNFNFHIKVPLYEISSKLAGDVYNEGLVTMLSVGRRPTINHRPYIPFQKCSNSSSMNRKWNRE